MADQYVNPTGLQIIKEWAKSKFTNKIEKIRVNGGEKTPDTDKAVDLVVPDYNNNDGAGSKIFTAIDSMNNPNYFMIQRYSSGDVYLKWQPYTGDTIYFKLVDQDYVDTNGGKIDEIYLNTVKQTIIDKKVYLRADTIDVAQSTEKVTWTHVGEEYSFDAALGNSTNGTTFEIAGTQTELVSKPYVDGTFRTEAQVQQAIDDSLADITNWDYSEPMLTLPATGEKGIIYLVAKGDVLEPPWDEWYWVTPKTGDPYFEKFGDTTIDLSTYWTMTDGKANSLVAMTVSEINAILNE